MKKVVWVTLLIGGVLIASYFWPHKGLAWHDEDGLRWSKLAIPWSGRVGFKELSGSETGITFANNLTREQITENQHLLNGSGLAVGDVNGDGLADVYFCRLNGPNVLYKNLGDWKFEDVTAAAGVACSEQFSTGAALADLDGDADLDLLVTTLGGPNFCFLNDGQGNFTDVTEWAGLKANTGATSMALADIDGDGDLDLYITNYKRNTVRDQFLPQDLEFDRIVREVEGGYEIVPEFKQHYMVRVNDTVLMRYEYAEPDQLYLNDGRGRFQAVSAADGRFKDEEGKTVSEPRDWGLTVRFQDIDQDGDPDIYVCNDFESPDRIWINDGSGNFRAIPKLAIRSLSWATMGVGFSDIDRDGDLDFMLLDMLSRDHRRRKTQANHKEPVAEKIGVIANRPQHSRNSLFLNRGDATYAEIARFSGVEASEWSWSPLFLDVDLDGFEDILIGTGHFYDALDADTLDRIRGTSYRRLHTWRSKIFTFPGLSTTNIAFRNRGNLTFEEVGEGWGFTSPDISHGMALGDLDGDGDLDMVINRLDAPAGVYKNESVAPRVAVRLRGLSPNTQGIGAKIRLLGGPVPQSKEVISAGSYLSSSDPLTVFAAGEDNHELTIEVAWRNGRISGIENVKPNRIYEIYESSANAADKAVPPPADVAQPYFEDVSYLINHVHHEDEYDDFRNQPLLPKRLSRLGPGVAWYDFDEDGDDDLVIGSGKGGELACLRNDGKDGFQRIKNELPGSKRESDQSAILGWTSAKGTTSLLIGESNLEAPRQSDAFVSRYDGIADLVKHGSQIGGGLSSIGPMTMADYDLDGDLDLFVGGRAIPGRYPEPASSTLYRNDGGSFELDSLNTERFKELGLVSGALFSDIDGDGDGDLILAIEWGPVTVFRNDGGDFSDATQELGLGRSHGLWNGVTTGDLDGDGRLEIIATNWGLNGKYQNRYDDEHPLKMFYSDFDNNGTVDIVEATFDHEMQELVPEGNLRWMQAAMPYIRTRMPSNKKYSQAGLQEIVGFKLQQAGVLKATTLAHTVFFNREDGFEAVEMPSEAQFAPAFYAGVADFDGDGHEDVFLSQNFFALPVETSRSDAGRGLWLQGDGNGRLLAIAGQDSGVKVYGEQRGAGLSDYDGDGRVDLVVSQNGAQTKLYHNVGAKPGLRIRLAGPKGNRYGVGATIRLVYADGYGPAREVHMGSGYWSQDSMVQVLGLRASATEVWVRWPGGKTENVPLRKGTSELTIVFNTDAVK